MLDFRTPVHSRTTSMFFSEHAAISLGLSNEEKEIVFVVAADGPTTLMDEPSSVAEHSNPAKRP